MVGKRSWEPENAGKRKGLTVFVLLKISFVCGISVALLMCISAPVILHFVRLTPQATVYLKGMFAVIAFYMIGRAVNDVTINGIFGAGGDTMFVCTALLCVCGVWQFRWQRRNLLFHWPVVLVYACTCIDEVGKLPWGTASFSQIQMGKRSERIKKQKKKKHVEDIKFN